MNPRLKRQLLAAATRPYKPVGPIHHYWARGKLSGDPIFAALIDDAIFPDQARVLDLGCGRGLLAAWHLAAEGLAAAGTWPQDARQPPRGLRFAGVELMAREADAGNQALQPLHGERVQLAGGDMRSASLDGFDVIAILDVLHYVDYAEQDRMLDRIRAALPPGGLFLTRIGDAEGGLRFRISQLVDRGISFIQGHRLPRMWCRPLPEWIAILEARGFVVSARPMNGKQPFANVMLVARVPEATR